MGAGGMADMDVELYESFLTSEGIVLGVDMGEPAGESLQELKDLDRALVNYAKAEAERIQEAYHHEIAALTPEQVKWPYEAGAQAWWRDVLRADIVFNTPAGAERIEPELAEQIPLLVQAVQGIKSRAKALEEAISAGKFKRKGGGEPWAYENVHNRKTGYICVTDLEARKLHGNYSQADVFYMGSFHHVTGTQYSPNNEAWYDPETGCIVEQPGSHFLFRPHNSYGLIVFFIGLGYEPELRKLFAPKRPRKQALPADGITMPVASVDGTIFNHTDEKAIQPQDYHTGECIKIHGKMGCVELSISTDAEIDAALEAYELNDYDRIIIATAASIAKRLEPQNGCIDVYGTQILKLMGRKNPYSQKARTSLEEAYNSIHKAMGTVITLDATEEARKYLNQRGMELYTFTKATNLIKAEGLYELDSSNRYDFALHITGDPKDAFPLHSYSTSKKFATTLPSEQFAFKSLHMTERAIGAWGRILTTIWRKSRHKDSEGYTFIAWEAFYAGAQLTERDKDKRKRLRASVKAMLDERAGISCGKDGKPYQKPEIAWKEENKRGIKVKPLGKQKHQKRLSN